jgi:hypothetical protein
MRLLRPRPGPVLRRHQTSAEQRLLVFTIQIQTLHQQTFDALKQTPDLFSLNRLPTARAVTP